MELQWLHPEMCPLQYAQYTHHEITFVLLCVSVLFVDNARCWFMLPLTCGCTVAITLITCISITTGLIAEMLLVLFFICNAV